MFLLTYLVTYLLLLKLLPPANAMWKCVRLHLSVCLSVCLSLCLSVCNTLTAESLHLKSVFLACGYIFRIFRSCSYLGHRVEVNVKVIGTNSSSVFAVQTLNVGCFDLERWFFCMRYIGISRSSSYVKVIGSRSRSQEQRRVSVCPVHGWFAFDWNAILFLYFFLFLAVLVSLAL